MQQQSDGKNTDPIRLIEEDHAWQLVLCDALENIADSLPNNIDRGLVEVSGEALRKVISQHNVMEENVLFPLLAKRADQTMDISETFKILRKEHDSDEAYALEIAEEFERFVVSGADDVRFNPEMLGYMLRGFFVSLRRHIDWENQTVLPLARKILEPDDLEELREWTRTHPEVSRCRRLLKTVGACLGHKTCPQF